MNQPDELFRLARGHHQAGRLTEAEDAYQQLLASHPQHAGALHGLGTLALQADESELAERLFRQAIAVSGEWPEACYHLGVALQAREQFDQAIMAHRRAIALNPALFDAHYQLAVCLQLTGQRDKAIAAYRQAIALRPNDPYALVNFAIALQSAHQFDEAIALLRQAIAIKPDFADAFNQLGTALRDVGNSDEAIAAFGRACQLKPQSRSAWAHLATALRETGQIGQAIPAQRQALALLPDDAEANWSLGKLLMLNGDIAEGAPLLEWRWKRKTLPWPRRRFTQPMWDGNDLAGRTIYLHAEQSIADAIHLARFIPLVAQRGGAIVAECQPSLRRLFENSFAGHQWFSPGEPAPAFDVYCPFMNLRGILGTMPADVPYLRIPPEASQRWRDKAPRDASMLKVGLTWAGSPSEIEDRKRSMSLADFTPLLELPGVQFFSLQKGWASYQARKILTDLTDTLDDFADTASLINQLDLVISVDTAVAHVAGALGKPVWTLLPLVPHWRWGMHGETTPWYPTMRLFRQARRGAWGDVVRRVAEELQGLANTVHG
jgi:tetratricopeptide (TPR) repeat protein